MEKSLNKKMIIALKEDTYDVTPKTRNTHGITLIALIITIIILLILAGVVINLTLGENGIINKAEQGTQQYKISEILERLELEKVDLYTSKNGEIFNVQEYVNYLISKGIVTQADVEDIDNDNKNILVEGYLFLIEKETNGNIKITYNGKPTRIPPSATAGATTHTPKQIQCTWQELNSIAKVISDNYGTEIGKINNDTVEVNVSIDEKNYNLGIGDWTTINGKTVRILGFNHDELTDQAVYGGKNTYAGISFELVDFITNARMNSSDTNVGGWGVCELRGTLNSSIYDGLENKKYIKEVSKEYIETYNDAGSITKSNDKLWLLSCSEIWNNGYTSGYGYAVGKEGEQYKYYKNINATYNLNEAKLIKQSSDWYLRSPHYNSTVTFCFIHASGACHSSLYRC